MLDSEAGRVGSGPLWAGYWERQGGWAAAHYRLAIGQGREGGQQPTVGWLLGKAAVDHFFRWKLAVIFTFQKSQLWLLKVHMDVRVVLWFIYRYTEMMRRCQHDEDNIEFYS